MRINPDALVAPAVETPAASATAGGAAGGAAGGGTDDGIGGAAQHALATLDELIGAVAGIDAMMNTFAAWRVELLEAVRTWAVQSAQLLVSDPWAPRAEHTAHLAMVAELACALCVPEQTATALVDDAQMLVETCPATLAALREGVISYRHAQVVLEHTDGLDQAERADLEHRLLTLAPGLTASTFARRARKERERSHPVPLVARHTKVLPKRCVQLDPARDGMAWLHQYLPAVEATAIFNRVSDIAASVQHPSDPRTLHELRADAFSALMLDDDAHDAFRRAFGAQAADGCEDSEDPSDPGDPTGPGDPSSGADRGCGATGGSSLLRTGDPAGASPLDRGRLLRGVRATVAVTVPVLTLLGHSDSPGTLEGYGPIDAETARTLAGRAPSFRRILTHPETGVVLSVGRDRYAVPADLKAALRLRDETCRFPGCSRRARRCDIDHITDWALGGTTDHDNLMVVCRRHHRLKHLSAWRPRIVPQASLPPGPPGALGPPPPPAPSEPSEPSAQSSPSDLFDATVEWTAPSGRVYSTDTVAHDRAPRLGFAFLASLGLSADFLIGIGIVPDAGEADRDRSSDAAGRSRPATGIPHDATVQGQVPVPVPGSSFPDVPPF